MNQLHAANIALLPQNWALINLPRTRNTTKAMVKKKWVALGLKGTHRHPDKLLSSGNAVVTTRNQQQALYQRLGQAYNRVLKNINRGLPPLVAVHVPPPPQQWHAPPPPQQWYYPPPPPPPPPRQRSPPTPPHYWHPPRRPSPPRWSPPPSPPRRTFRNRLNAGISLARAAGQTATQVGAVAAQAAGRATMRAAKLARNTAARAAKVARNKAANAKKRYNRQRERNRQGKINNNTLKRHKKEYEAEVERQNKIARMAKMAQIAKEAAARAEVRRRNKNARAKIAAEAARVGAERQARILNAQAAAKLKAAKERNKQWKLNFLKGGTPTGWHKKVRNEILREQKKERNAARAAENARAAAARNAATAERARVAAERERVAAAQTAERENARRKQVIQALSRLRGSSPRVVSARK